MTDGQKDGWTSGLSGVLSQPIICSMYFLFPFTIRFIVCSVCSYVSILYELNVVLSELRAYLNRCSLTAPALHIVNIMSQPWKVEFEKNYWKLVSVRTLIRIRLST